MAGLVDASEAVIMSMIITRTTGLTDAGYISIAFAIGILLLTIGKYGVYNFQVTDHQHEYSFHIYFKLRAITTAIMLLGLISYLIYGRYILEYNNSKTMIVLFIGLIYSIEAYEDLIRAHCQYIGKLYAGAIMFIIRWLVIIVSFGIVVYYTKNTSTALGISLGLSAIVFITCCYYAKSKYFQSEIRNKSNIGISGTLIDLSKNCFPMFLSSFLSLYVANSPKYAIERYMGAAEQGCYGFVSMPVFIISLLNAFMFQPQMLSMADDHAKNPKRFKARTYRQYMIIASLTIICIAGAYWIGIPILSIIFHTDLSNYRHELLILILCGGFLALSAYQIAILTIMRHQKYLFYGYIPITILALLFVGTAVKSFGTLGAAFSYLILIIILCIIYEFFIRKELADVS